MAEKLEAYREHSVVYIEYQSVCPFVGIESHIPLHRKRECLPLGPKGGEQHTLADEGVEGQF